MWFEIIPPFAIMVGLYAAVGFLDYGFKKGINGVVSRNCIIAKVLIFQGNSSFSSLRPGMFVSLRKCTFSNEIIIIRTQAWPINHGTAVHIKPMVLRSTTNINDRMSNLIHNTEK